MMNIGDVKDVHHRYKMPVPLFKHEGKGNGKRTLITNMKEVAIALKVPPIYPTNFFGLKFNTIKSYDESTGTTTINGDYRNEDVMSYLNEFINKFVLCPTCKLPETTIQVEKNETILLKCAACGKTNQVSPLEKLCTFISKNPPKDLNTNSSIVSSEKKQNQTQEQILTKDQLIDDQNIEWSTDTSEDAIKKRRDEEGLSERIKNLTIVVDSDEEIEVSPVDLLKEFINKRPNSSEQQLLKAALKIKKDYDLKDSDVAYLLFESCFDDKNIMSNLKKRGKVLHRFIKTKACQKNCSWIY